MTEFITKSGAQVVINLAPWVEAKELKKAIQRIIGKNGIDLNEELPMLICRLCMVDSNDEFEAALYRCLARCLYNGQKIQFTTFDAEEARAEYYDVIVPCVQKNVGPLVGSLFSQLIVFGLMKPKTEEKDPAST